MNSSAFSQRKKRKCAAGECLQSVGSGAGTEGTGSDSDLAAQVSVASDSLRGEEGGEEGAGAGGGGCSESDDSSDGDSDGGESFCILREGANETCLIEGDGGDLREGWSSDEPWLSRATQLSLSLVPCLLLLLPAIANSCRNPSVFFHEIR